MWYNITFNSSEGYHNDYTVTTENAFFVETQPILEYASVVSNRGNGTGGWGSTWNFTVNATDDDNDTMTVRLYNPMPGNKDATIKYIAAPIAALMLLAIPISADGVTYSWPFIHKIVSPGIYNLDPAFISNITIIKGGDQQQIGQNQALGVVDVRIDFGSLFSSMLAAKGTGKTRPTLQTYLDAMVGPDSSKPVQNFSTSPRTPLDEQLQITNRRRQQEQLAITRNQSPTEDTLTDEEKDNPPDRVSTTTRATSSDLLSRMPEGFRQTFGGGR